MSKAVLMSIQPKWCKLIVSGKKTVEVRKTKPKPETPLKVYIYCTKDNTDIVPSRIWWKVDKTGFQHILNGMVIGEFVCDDIAKILNYITHFGIEGRSEKELNTIARESCLDYMDMLQYFTPDKDGYAWHISDLVIYDKPRALSTFGVARAPQSWCYVEELEVES